ncbi:MAG: 16S rRNA (guanine(527)-N(7))-methyltransferase RsmG [Pseudomonadota bacterium]|nr:16S rRNA (guanine(527)-N(7))-methyltransferase RsmG [Pseudomonadota bacterium]
MSKHLVVGQGSVSRETEERLETYADLLIKWNRKINLVSQSTIGALWERHFLDSAQLLELAPPQSGTWVDLGTGGGFPGLIIAILATETAPSLRVTCIESDQRKAAFLRTVIRETGADANIVCDRIESAEPANADVVSARALAPLDDLVDFAERHMKKDGTALFLKGEGYRDELDIALENWRFQVDTVPSKTHPDAVILKLGGIERA